MDSETPVSTTPATPIAVTTPDPQTAPAAATQTSPTPQTASLAAPPVVLHFRLSFLWTETLLGLLTGNVKPQGNYSFLTPSSAYKQRFEEIQDAPGDLQPPWEGPHQRFWNFYLPGIASAKIDRDQAWNYLVPIRIKSLLGKVRWAKGDVLVETFCYPHGLAAVTTFTSRGKFAPDEVRELAYAIRKSEQFSITSAGKEQQQSLKGLALKALDMLRESIAPGSQTGARPDQPFSLLSVIQGEGVDPGEPTPNGGSVHRLLDAVTNWPPNPETAKLHPIKEAGCDISSGSSDGSVLYGGKFGRAIWFPGLFTLTNPRASSASCYHRNNLMGAMQVESLGPLVASTAAILRKGKRLSELDPAHESCARNATTCLETVFGGDTRLTYRSDSLRRHIRTKYLQDLNQLRRAIAPGVADLS